MPLIPTSARAKFLVNTRHLIFGPPKHGKTLWALTISDHFKGFPAPAGQVVKLSDIVHIGFDPNALDGAVEQGYDVPHYFDLSDKAVGVRILAELDNLSQNLVKYVTDHKIKAVIVDTISFLDKNLVGYYHGQAAGDGRKLYGNVLAVHNRFADLLKMLPCHVLVLAHATFSAPDVTDEAGKKKEVATGLPGSGGISSQITGQTKGTYEGMVSMILPIQCVKVPDPKKSGAYADKRFCFPKGGSGFEGAARLQRYLDEKEEADDFKRLLEKIRAGHAKDYPDAVPSR